MFALSSQRPPTFPVKDKLGNWRQMEMQADLILWLALFVVLGAVAIFL